MSKRILIVSTNDELNLKLYQFLSNKDFTVVGISKTYEDILNQLSVKKVDAILLNISDEDIKSFLTLLRYNAETSNIPLITIKGEEIEMIDTICNKINNIFLSHRILIAEDDRIISSTLVEILKSRGFDIKVAYNGVDALKIIKEWHPDLVVLDIMLPLIDGFHICQTINEDFSYGPQPYILIISGRDSILDQNLALACGADDYLVKPFDNLDFISKVTSLFSKETVRTRQW